MEKIWSFFCLVAQKIKAFIIRNSKIIWATVYFALAVVLGLSVSYSAYKNSYIRIFVSGQSMSPTLDGGQHSGGAQVGDTVDFGYMDSSNQAINHMKRFNIVITYFPYSWGYSDYTDASEKTLSANASYKIKRLMAFPNETISVSNIDGKETMVITGKDNAYSYTYTYIANSFKPEEGYWIDQDEHIYHYAIKEANKSFTVTLGEDEYFVMGDNWPGSSDSSTHISKGNLTRHNLQGILVAIEGKATVVNDASGNRTISDLVYQDQKYYYTEL